MEIVSPFDGRVARREMALHDGSRPIGRAGSSKGRLSFRDNTALDNGSRPIGRAGSSKGRLSECQRSLTRMTSTVKVEGLIREIVNRDEDAGGDTEPKSSNRAKNCWFMAGAGHREEGSRAESDKVPTSRLLDGGRT